MAPRPELQQILVDLLGSSNVYFQPPPTLVMSYPCIVYKREDMEIRHANDHPYKHMKRYSITVIDRNPDSEIPDKIAELPMVRYDRFYTAENLNHDVFQLFF
jgi:hypothetical protein